MALPVEVNPIFLENRYPIQRSLRFRLSASAYLNRTPSVAGNQKTWAWSGWVKRGAQSSRMVLLDGSTSGTAGHTFEFTSANAFEMYSWGTGPAAMDLISTPVFRDSSSWYHIVLSVDTTQATASNRIIIYVNGVQITAYSTASYPAQNSNLYINNNILQSIGRRSDAQFYLDGYLAEVNFIDTPIMVGSTNGTTTITLTSGTTTGLGVGWNVGGTNIPSGATITSITSSTQFVISSAATGTGSSISFGATPPLSAFGQYNEFGVWSPRKYGGSYGTNGFYLQFTDIALTSGSNAGLGKDFSGNTNYWTTNNISVTAGTTYDAMTDVPTPSTIQNVAAGNYATLNPLMYRFAIGQGAYSNANLTFTYSGASSAFGFGSIGASSGKWYFEATLTAIGTGTPSIGIADIQCQSGTFTNLVEYTSNGTHYGSGGAWATFTTGNIIGIGYDLDNSTISFYKNGSLQGTVAINSNITFFSLADTSLNGIWDLNFGQRPFNYSNYGTDRPAATYLPLNTNNLPSPTIPNGAQYMAAVTYTGNGTASTAITASSSNSGNNPLGTTFQPDLVWIKSRSAATNNNLFDTLRTATNYLISNSTAANASNANTLTAFNSNGFTLGTDAGSIGVNINTNTYVGWQWNAGSGVTSTNTDGTVTGTVTTCVNKSAGFSVVTFTSSSPCTVGHGLGAAPSFIILKSRNNASGWSVYHSSIGNTGALNLQATTGTSTTIDWWSNTSPTSLVFSIGANIINTWTWVGYCWAPISFYSAMGSYTGNGSTDGPFVYTGFRPRFILYKRTDAVGDWRMFDTSRDTYNVSAAQLLANTSGAEANSTVASGMDFLSNGFKLRNADGYGNASGGTYIYAAFAENPFRMALAR